MGSILSLLFVVTLLFLFEACCHANELKAKSCSKQNSEETFDFSSSDEDQTESITNTHNQTIETNDLERIAELEHQIAECNAERADLVKEKETMEFENQLLSSGSKVVVSDVKAVLSKMMEGLTERYCEELPWTNTNTDRLVHCKFKALPNFFGFMYSSPNNGQGGASKGAEIALKLAHPSLVNAIRYTAEEGKLWMEYYPGMTSLRSHFIKNQRRFVGRQGTGMIKFIAARLLLGLHYIHTSGFVHRKVNIDNIVILADGRAKLMSGDRSYIQIGQFQPASDIFACGLVVYQLASNLNLPPGMSKANTHHPVDTKQLRPDFYRVEGRSDRFNDLLKLMFMLSDIERPSAFHLLQHPFFTGVPLNHEQGSENIKVHHHHHHQ